MKLFSLLSIYLSAASALSFFETPRSEKIKNHLAAIGYEIVDGSGDVKDSVFESWDQADLQGWLEAHKLAAKGSLEDLQKQAIKHKKLLADDVKQYAAAGHKQGEQILGKGAEYYKQTGQQIASLWSDSKLKEFLDARGYNVPQTSTRDELLRLVAQAKYNGPLNTNGPAGKYWFDNWSVDELKDALVKLGEDAEGTRKELSKRLYDSYTTSFEKGKKAGDKTANDVASTLAKWREATFDKWSTEDLKDYVSDFGDNVGNTKDELVDSAKRNYRYFVYGEDKAKSTFEESIENLKSYQASVHQHVFDHFRGHYLRLQSLYHWVLSKLFSAEAFVKKEV